MNVYFIYKDSLYAITNNKKVLDSFLSERNPKLFKIVKHKMTRETYLYLIKDYHKYQLDFRQLETKSNIDIGRRKIKVAIVATEYEEMDVFLKADKVFTEIGEKLLEICEYFNEDVLKALETLHYFELYKFSNNFTEQQHFYDGYYGMPVFDIKNYTIDQLGLFIYLYGNTMQQ